MHKLTVKLSDYYEDEVIENFNKYFYKSLKCRKGDFEDCFDRLVGSFGKALYDDIKKDFPNKKVHVNLLGCFIEYNDSDEFHLDVSDWEVHICINNLNHDEDDYDDDDEDEDDYDDEDEDDDYTEQKKQIVLKLKIV